MAPLYIALAENGELQERVRLSREMMLSCRLCPRLCKINRLAGEKGKCRTTTLAVVSSSGPHFGEEALLVGRGGSGTIFFTNCNLRCIFCQNYNISQLGEGQEVTSSQLVEMMLSLQKTGCHNINLVTPTHVVPQILEALELAIARGLSLPLVYNCGGYESVETLKLLDGVIDIYMPDMKYSDNQIAERLSGIREYVDINRAALKEMHRQVGDLIINEKGIANRGLLVRHLVLPQDLAGTSGVIKYLAEDISRTTYINLMAQYRPCYKAWEHPLLRRSITRDEYIKAIQIAQQYGLKRIDSIHSPLVV